MCPLCRARHTPAPRPHSSRQGESRRVGRHCLSSNVRRTRTQTIIPPYLYSSPSACATCGAPPPGPHCCPSRWAPGGGPRRLRRLRPHLSKLAAGEPRGQLGRGPPFSLFLTHPGCRGEWARATRAGRFICLLILSPRLPRRVVTQKRGIWWQLSKSLLNESCHWGFLSRRPLELPPGCDYKNGRDHVWVI